MRLYTLACRNLIRRPVRTTLTVLGVTVAVAFTVALLSIGEGFLRSFEETILKYGTDVYITPRDEFLGIPVGVNGEHRPFPEDLALEVGALPNVRLALPVLRVLDLGSTLTPLLVFGIPAEQFWQFKPLARLQEGRLWSGPTAEEAVAGHAVATALKLQVGENLLLSGHNFRLAGILAPTGGIDDSIIYVPLPVLQEIRGQPSAINEVLVRVSSVSSLEQTVEALRARYPHLAVYTAAELFSQLMKLFSIAQAMHFSVASIGLLIGVLFVTSTMLMSVSERTREIGVMRALGASPRYIFALILTEALFISTLAGLVGCLGGWGLSHLLALVATRYFNLSLFRAAVSLRILALSMAIALAVGGVAGLYPAWQMTRLRIVEVLRRE
ncbi:MAG: ABC transporter permease [Bacillota bacterium]|nr:ABC transporter permease [Bacillota bacterium]